MPQVPTVDGPRVQQSPLRGGENTTRAINTGAGMLTSAAGAAITGFGDVGDRIQERRDLDEAFRVETKVLADYGQFEQNLRKTRRGAAAKDVVNDVDQWWSKVDESYGAEVSPRVKQLTAKSLARARAQALDATGKYQMAEEDRAQTESYTAVNGQEIQRAITLGTPEALASAKGKIGAAVSVFGATRGWTTEQLDAERQKWTNALHIQAVNSLIDSNPKAAKSYFEENRSEIDSANHARMTKLIDRGVAESNATENAQKWANLPFEQAIENANKITDPDERKLTHAAIKDMQSEKNIAMQLREKAASDKVWQMVAGGTPMNRLPKATLEQMDGRERVQVNAYYEAERKRREAEAKGHDIKTDPAVYGAVLDKIRQDPAGTRPESFAGLSRGDIRSLQNHRDSLLGAKPGREAEVASTEQQMGGYINGMKLKAEAKGAFQKSAYDAFEEYRAVNKKEPNYEERAKILDRLSIEKAVDGGWFSSKRFFEANPEERAAFVNKTVPQVDREQIKEVLKVQGKPYSMMNVMDMWERMQMKKRQEAAAKGQK